MKIFTTGLIVLIVAIIGSVVGGVCVCMYFYQDGRKKRQIRPEELEPKMMEPFSTKKYWERGRRPVILEDGDEDSTLPASVNPSSGPHTSSPLSDDISPEPLILSSNGVSTTTTFTSSRLSTSSPSIMTTSTVTSSGTTVVEVS